MTAKKKKELYSQLLPILRTMVRRMIPMTLTEIRRAMLANCNQSIRYSSDYSLLNDCKEAGLLEMSSISSQKYIITAEKFFTIVESYKDPKEWQKELDSRQPSMFEDEEISAQEWLSGEMVNFVQGKAFLTDDEETDKRLESIADEDFITIFSFLHHAMHKEKWIPFIQRVTQFIPWAFYHSEVIEPFYELEAPKPEILDFYFFGDNKFERNAKTESVYNFQALIDLAHGDIPAALKRKDETYERGMLVKAIAQAYTDPNPSEAVVSFERAFDIDHCGSLVHHASIGTFYYAVSLMNEMKTSRAHIAERRLKWLKKDFKDSSKGWMTLLVDRALGVHFDTEKKLGKLISYLHSPIDSLLTSIVLRYYYGMDKLSDYPSIIASEFKVLESPYKLLIIEYAHARPEFKQSYEMFCREMNVQSPLRGGLATVPKWERLLTELTSLTESEKSQKAKKGEKLARVIYYMRADAARGVFYFTPRLQKSSDGVKWTSGRNIALKNFAANTEGMTPADHRVASMVKAYSYGYYGETTYELEGTEVVEALIGHPGVFIEGNPTPVNIVSEELQVTVKRGKHSFTIHPNVTPKSNLNRLNVVCENELLYKVIRLTDKQRDILRLLDGNTEFPLEAEKALTTFLAGLSRDTTVLSDMLKNAATNAKSVQADSIITVRLRPVADGMQADLLVRPFGTDGPYCQPAQGTELIAALIGGKSLKTNRNLKREAEHLKALTPIVNELADETDGNTYTCLSPTASLSLLEALYKQTNHCRLEWPEGERWRINRTVEAPDLALTVKGAKGWFEVDGELQVSEDRVMKIGELLQLMRDSKSRFVQVGESEFIALSDQLRRHLAHLEAMAATGRKGKVQLSPFSTTALQELEEHGVKIDADRQYAKFIKRLHDAGEAKFSFPRNLQADLRDYQRDGVRWMARLAAWGAGACLADDMGLGKTLQAITLMLARSKEGPSLVVAPTSVTLNWRNEIERFAPSLSVVLINAPSCDRKTAVEGASAGDVVIATYGLLVTEAELLTSRQWNMAVLDEAHTIKNKDTKMSHGAMMLQADFRLLLTGTPVQNHLGELWNLFQFSNPGLLGTNAQFQEKFILPIEKHDDKERLRQLKRMVTPFILRRTKNEVLDELPEKSEITISIELSDDEMSVYENLRRSAMTALESGESSPMQALAEITRLRQAACNVRLIDNRLHTESSKLTRLISMVHGLMESGHRALVFSQFTSHLALVREALDAEKIEHLYLDGSCSARERERLVKEFQTGSAPLFLISLKAGGTGLNLTAADYVFHLDPWWNPAIEDQASDRTYRIGQTRPVTIYRLIAQQTIEEKILRLHSTKKSLADSLLEGTGASHKLTREEMLELLR